MTLELFLVFRYQYADYNSPWIIKLGTPSLWTMSPEDYICYHTGFIHFMKFEDLKEMRMYHQNSLPVLLVVVFVM